MMQQRSDERLVAYLDGELEAAQQREVEAWLDADPSARQRMAALAESAHLLRLALNEAIYEPVPDRLIAAARGETSRPQTGAEIVPFHRRLGAQIVGPRRWWIGLPVAASLFGILAGGGIGYLGGKLALDSVAGKHAAPEAMAANNLWLDNAAGYFKLVVNAGDTPPVDIPATGDPREALQKIAKTCQRRSSCLSLSLGVSASAALGSSSRKDGRRRRSSIRRIRRRSGLWL